MNRTDLIRKLSQAQRLSYRQAAEIVNAFFAEIAGTLQSGGRVEIRGFGTLQVKAYDPYEGRNPRNGQPVRVASRKRPFFRCSRQLKERLNSGPSPKGV